MRETSRVKAVFIVPPDVQLLDLTGPAQIFSQAASMGAPLELVYCSTDENSREERSSSALSFNNLVSFESLDLHKGDFIFVPGTESSLLNSPEWNRSIRPFLNWLVVQHRKEATIVSICIGSFIVAAAGLLDNRNCTTHWEFAERFKKKFPKIKMLEKRLFVEDDNIYSSAGITAGIDLSLYLIEKRWGSYLAAQIAKEAVIYFRRTIEDPQLSIFTQYRNHMDHRIHEVQDIISKTLDHRFSRRELAERVNMSTRNLTRLFKKTTQITINDYVSKMRVERAEKLLLDGHTFQAAALHCGLKSVNQLRTLLNGRLKK